MASAKPITHVYTSGRPPWFNLQGELRDAFVIGIAGGSASGQWTSNEKNKEEEMNEWRKKKE